MSESGTSNKPSTWAGQDLATLKTSLANHTTDVLTQLKKRWRVTRGWVRVGNETNDGMLWPEEQNLCQYE